MKHLRLFEEFYVHNNNSDYEEKKERIFSSLRKQYQLGIDVYNALLKDGGQDSINKRKKEIEYYFNENTHIDLQSIIRGSREISDSQSSLYYIGNILTYLYKTAFSGSFFKMMSNQPTSFDNWYKDEKVEDIVNKILESSPKSTSESRLFEEFDIDGYKSHWDKFKSFLQEKDFELYDGEEDLYNKFMEIANDDNYSSEEKADHICSYLEDKWGLHDGYTETWDYLEALFMDEI
jgi:hypothetical protein